MNASPRTLPVSRRFAVTLLALVAAVTLLAPAATLASRADRESAALVPVLDQVERKVALGISTPYGYQVKKLRRIGTRIGRMPALWTIWSRWGDKATRAFPAEVAGKVAKLGVTPLIWWEPANPGKSGNPFYPRYANTTAGTHDRYIRRYARAARKFGKTVLLRYAPEPNGSYHPWTEGKFDNTAETFIAAWRHIWEIFRQEGAANVKFVWSVSKETCQGGCNPYAEFYPGDEYVDYMAFSSFNWGAQKDGWVSMVQGFTRVHNLLASISFRPIIAIESASNGEGGDKPAWIREGYPLSYASFPAIVAIVYLNADLRYAKHPDWRIGSPPEAMTAYAEIAATAEYSGRIKKRSGGTIQDALNATPTASRQ
ncbi:hypothetical protein BH24CHL9_BH24CHL9_07100 [soil metagenome]